MTWIIKTLTLVLFGLIGGILYAVTTNILLLTDGLDSETIAAGFGQEMTTKAVIIWLVSMILGAISLFIQNKWRIVMTLLPLYAPSLFAIFYALSQSN